VADAALQRGEPVAAVVRRPESAAALRADGIPAAALDLDRPVVDLPRADDRALFYFVPPPSEGTTDPRIGRLLDALPHRAGRRIVYISTTGVYGDCGGEWVDERRPARPMVDRARRRHDAERQLLAWRDAGHGEVVILRVAGIYGPGKLPLARLRRQVPMIAAAEAPWTNRIHIDDLVEVCTAAMQRGEDGEAYNVSDGTPGNMRDYFDRVADLYGLPRAPLIGLAEARAELSPGMLSYLGESRRLDNRKLLRDLGVTLRYPDLASGLAACAAADPPR
jgi:nucleoside-diphosphate-sugar epimerase